MQNAVRRGLASTLALVLLTLGLTIAPTVTAAEAKQQPDGFYVVNNNIENRSCDYRWVTLLEILKKDYTQYPDVLTLQQVAGTSDLEIVKKKLENKWGITYDGVLSRSVAGSADMGCAKTKGAQSNAVLWRTDRFKPVDGANSVIRWHSDGQMLLDDKKDRWSGCTDLAVNEVFKNQKRARNVAVALKDLQRPNTHVVVASVHWPLEPKGAFMKIEGSITDRDYKAHPCAKENMQEAHDNLTALITTNNLAAKTTKVIGGDMNANTSIDGWWKRATQGLGYIDPIAQKKCSQTSPADYVRCSGDPKRSGAENNTRANRVNRNLAHRTTAVNRIDYVLIQHGTTTTESGTVPQPLDPGQKLYSNHRAVLAAVIYKN